jgi:hypothetical protein
MYTPNLPTSNPFNSRSFPPAMAPMQPMQPMAPMAAQQAYGCPYPYEYQPDPNSPLVTINNYYYDDPSCIPPWRQDGFPNRHEYRDYQRWIDRNDLNRYGDPRDTYYTGGTPLYDEATGETLKLYEYLLQNHPDRPWRDTSPIGSNGKMSITFMYLMLAMLTAMLSTQNRGE